MPDSGSPIAWEPASHKTRPKSLPHGTAAKYVKDIRRAAHKQYPVEKRIRIVLEGLRGEHSVAELFRREGIPQSLSYSRFPSSNNLEQPLAIAAFMRRALSQAPSWMQHGASDRLQ